MWFNNLTIWIEFCSIIWLRQNSAYTLSSVIKILTITLSESIIVLSRWAMVKTVQHLNLLRMVSWIKASVLWSKEMKRLFRHRIAPAPLRTVYNQPSLHPNFAPLPKPCPNRQRWKMTSHVLSLKDSVLKWCDTLFVTDMPSIAIH